MIYSRLAETSGGRPGSGGWIVEFGAREISGDRNAKAACHKHPAIEEQRRPGVVPIDSQAAGR